MNDPNSGKVMQGCGGISILRASDPGRYKGSRGGVRIIYLYVLELKIGRRIKEHSQEKIINRDSRNSMHTKSIKNFFQRVKQGLEEGAAHIDGKTKLKEIQKPEEPPLIAPETIASLRKLAARTQVVFDKMLNVSTKTLQSWEQGHRQPSDASRRLIQVFSIAPEVICRSAGIPEVKLEGVQIEESLNYGRWIVVKPLPIKTKVTKSTK
jgi:putative transcriptional regulator